MMDEEDRPPKRPTSRSVKALNLPLVGQKIMRKSAQRAGEVGKGTLLTSGSRQFTVSFPPRLARLIELAAANARVSTSEMVRQCVDAHLKRVSDK